MDLALKSQWFESLRGNYIVLVFSASIALTLDELRYW